MGTLDTAIGKIRLRINENKVQFFSDADIVSLINDQIRYAYNLMKGIECKAIININKILLVEGTAEYLIDDLRGVVSGQVLDTNGSSIPLYNDLYPESFSYQLTATGIKFFNFVDSDEVIVYSWKSLPELNVANKATADLPFEGFWDDAITRAVIVECQEVREHDNSRSSVFASQASEDALFDISEHYGVISRTMRGTLNV
jgi:hypothetical protein